MLFNLPDHSQRSVEPINRPTNQNPRLDPMPILQLRPNQIQHPLGEIEMVHTGSSGAA
jgi:hypothetical protein